MNPHDSLSIAEQANFGSAKLGAEKLVLPLGQDVPMVPGSACPHRPEELIDRFLGDGENLIIAVHDRLLGTIRVKDNVAMLVTMMSISGNIFPFSIVTSMSGIGLGIAMVGGRMMMDGHVATATATADDYAYVNMVDNMHGILNENIEIVHAQKLDDLIEVRERDLCRIRHP